MEREVLTGQVGEVNSFSLCPSDTQILTPFLHPRNPKISIWAGGSRQDDSPVPDWDSSTQCLAAASSRVPKVQVTMSTVPGKGQGPTAGRYGMAGMEDGGRGQTGGLSWVLEAQHQAIPVPAGLTKTDGVRSGSRGEKYLKILLGKR